MDFPLLQKYKIPVLPYAFAKSCGEAKAAAKKIGYPLVLKLVSKNVLHKTEKGAVIVDIREQNALEEGCKKLFALDNSPSSSVLVQKMAKARLELIIGGRIDPQFGPIVLFGTGGIYVEVLKDRSLRACPIEEEEALLMIREIRSYPILQGVRGGKGVDENELAKIIVKASNLMAKEKPSELDINPLIWTNDGIFAADARVIR